MRNHNNSNYSTKEIILHIDYLDKLELQERGQWRSRQLKLPMRISKYASKQHLNDLIFEVQQQLTNDGYIVLKIGEIK